MTGRSALRPDKEAGFYALDSKAVKGLIIEFLSVCAILRLIALRQFLGHFGPHFSR